MTWFRTIEKPRELHVSWFESRNADNEEVLRFAISRNSFALSPACSSTATLSIPAERITAADEICPECAVIAAQKALK